KATLKAPAEAVGQTASLRIQLAKKRKSLKTVSAKTLVLKRSQTIKVPRPSKGGKAVVRVSLPTFTAGDTRFDTPAVKRTYHEPVSAALLRAGPVAARATRPIARS